MGLGVWKGVGCLGGVGQGLDVWVGLVYGQELGGVGCLDGVGCLGEVRCLYGVGCLRWGCMFGWMLG